MRFPFTIMSYINVTLCVFAIVVTGYMSAANTLLELQFLQYWSIAALLITGLINVALFLRQCKTEAHEVVYELKMLHAMYLSNALVHYVVINNEQSAISNTLLNNLIHCCALMLLFVELTVLLGHALGTYLDYRYAKACFMIIIFVCGATTIMLTGASSLRGAPMCNDILMAAIVTSVYLLIAIVWAVRAETVGSNLQNVQVVPFIDPPPSFASVELENMLKTKV